MAYSLSGTSLGEIQSEDVTLTIQTIDWQPVIGNTSDTEVIKMSSPKRVFDLNVTSVTGVTGNNTMAAQLITWVNATGTRTYVSDIHTDATGVNVVVVNANSNFVAGSRRILNYTLKLIEADTVI